jgi:predicted nucleic acid-binding protein
VPLLIDTGPLELLRRRDRRMESLALQHYPPILPLPSVGEFFYGQVLAKVAPEALMKAQEFIATFEILGPDVATALTYARLRSQAKLSGHLMPALIFGSPRSRSSIACGSLRWMRILNTSQI